MDGTQGECAKTIRRCVTVKFNATIIARSSKLRRMNATSEMASQVDYGGSNSHIIV